jgi:cyclopropane fatty-acyl-phospholipid synthase-like methyltransferase
MLLKVKEFYDDLCFPGNYAIDDLQSYGDSIENQYLELINKEILDGMTILDAGCGTGLISNLFALRNKNCNVIGVDFSNAVNYAEKFAKDNNINNVTFLKEDIATYTTNKKFDLIICQGVLHHIPEYQTVLEKLLDRITNNGKMILGLYHPFGRLTKKFVDIDYKSNILYKDQELNPYSLTFTYNQVKKMIPGWKINQCTPKLLNSVSAAALFNYRNGGLVTYILERDK